MKLIFLGSGSAFTIGGNNYHSNMILRNDEGNLLLIDCGSDVRFSLHEMGLTHRDIEDVFVSHLHADHVGGLEWLGFSTKFDTDCKKPNLYVSQSMADDLWNKTLSGGLSSLQNQKVDLSTYFNVHRVKDDGVFKWHKLALHVIPTVHVKGVMKSHGLLFKANGINTLITTDTNFSPEYMGKVYRKAELIFHDCETNPIKSGVHSHYDELVTLPNVLKNKMWLYHYNSGPLPNAQRDGFRGFVKKGQVFDFNDPSTLTPH